MMWRSSPNEDRPIRRPTGRLAGYGIVLLALLAVTGCGSGPPDGATVPAKGPAASTLTKQRVEKLKGMSGVAPGGQPR
jgi:hypothetical protein